MAKYRPIDTRLWHDRKFLSLGDDGRMLWLFLLTAPSSIAIPGIVIGGEASLAEQLGWSVERLREGFRELFEKGLSVRVDGRLVWLQNALRYQPPANPNVVKGWAKAWDDIPECSLKRDIWEALKIACKSWPKLFEQEFPEPSGDGSCNGSRNRYRNDSGNRCIQDQDQDQEQKIDIHPRARAKERHPDAGRVASKVWEYGAKVRAELAAANVHTPPWPLMVGTDHAGWVSLLDRVGELLVGSTAEEAERVCRNRVDVAAEKARADGDGNWFTPSAMFSRRSFDAWAHLDATTLARKGRARARATPTYGASNPRTDHPETPAMRDASEVL